MIHRGDQIADLLNPETGTLTPGVHHATLGALHEYGVTSPRREQIWDGFQIWLEAAQERLSPASLWIGGSYITAKVEPSDLDVLAWTPGTADSGARVAELMTLQHVALLDPDGATTKRFRRIQPIAGLIDGFASRDTPTKRAQWLLQWSNDWDDCGEIIEGAGKGIVEVSLG